MKPHYNDGQTTIHLGDCLDVLRALPDESVHAVVTDPPYGLSNTDPSHVVETLTRWASGERDYIPTGKGFMGKAWDSFVPPPAVWDECMRVLKPGGHLLAFAGSRTFDLMTLSIRFAGFDIRDSLAWLYGSGFPKSMDVSKAIDKAAGAEREVTGRAKGAASSRTESLGVFASEYDATAPATDSAREWQGWGTALKPAFEPVVVARKPFPGTVAANVMEHGTGALNVDATRVGDEVLPPVVRGISKIGTFEGADGNVTAERTGRWPANVVLDESQAAALDAQSGVSKSPPVGSITKTKPHKSSSMVGGFNHDPEGRPNGYGDSGSASRFFYVAKAPKSERPVFDGVAHPTVKPLALMRWLIRLVTPPNGIVLEPFAGSGTTVEAAILEGFDVIGVEREPDYWPLIRQRIARGNEVEL